MALTLFRLLSSANWSAEGIPCRSETNGAASGAARSTFMHTYKMTITLKTFASLILAGPPFSKA